MKVLIDISKKSITNTQRSGRRNNGILALNTERAPSPNMREPMFIVNSKSVREKSPQ
jgi:hypothetical protein